MVDAHAVPAAAVLDRLGVDASAGLTAADAARRLADGGPNELQRPRPVSLLAAFVDAATEPFVILLAVAGGLAVALGEVRDGLLVLLGLIPIVGADVVTTFRGERALEELRKAAAPRAHVRRDGAVVERLARDLVPGDIVLLRVGDVVPADLRLIRCEALSLDRSVLTGESLPEPGRVEPDPAEASVTDRHSIAFAGTAVVLGRGEGVVVATGAATELGRIAGTLGELERGRSPLQRELDRLVRILLVVAIGLIAITMGLGFLRGATPGEAVLAGVAAAIAAIPEEPPVLLAVILGLGAYRLLKKGVLVRRLSAQETLGAIDLIVTDKTGTLTENRLALAAVLTPGGEIVDPAARRALVATAYRAEDDAWVTDTAVPRGSFTRAIALAFGEEGPPRLDRVELVSSRPPDDLRPYASTVARRDGATEELALGAPEAVLELAGSGAATQPWRELVDASAGAGRRLLLLAGRRDGAPWQPRAVFAFTDTLRPGVAEALRTATEAGIQTIVVTGDHPTTAATIARAAGLSLGRVVTGPELATMSDGEVRSALAELSVVARVTPEQKLRLVEAARTSDRTVAVTGDGVNDAPALQRADVGVAMGSGSAVAREAADLVLGDDSFATLMDGLREGRRIVANVQKGLVFLTSTHVALLGYILIATLVGFGQPLLPIQILWLELFIDLSASVAFEREPIEPDAMLRRPRPRHVPLLTRPLLARVALAGGVTAVAALVLVLLRDGGEDHARWLAFNVLVLGQVMRAYANRSLTAPITSLGPNRFLALTCLAVVAIQLAIPYVPPLAEAFRATTLSATEMTAIVAIAVAPAIVAEIVRRARHTTWVA
ncbi:MAG TPA: cation-transporting P-type ATPase [Candidatus Limnocylindrales bacterium]